MSFPTFLGIGAMKAGTTTIYEYLKHHPEVFVPLWKELDWFTPMSTMPQEEYESIFPESYQVRGEYSPNYQGFVSKILKTYPDIKLILSVRDPITKFISTVRHALTYGKIPIDVDKLIEEGNSTLVKQGYYKDTIIAATKAKIHVINFENLVENQQDVFDDLCEFLEISKFDIPYIHQFSSETWSHKNFNLTEKQKEKLEEYYKISNEFLEYNYWIKFKGL